MFVAKETYKYMAFNVERISFISSTHDFIIILLNKLYLNKFSTEFYKLDVYLYPFSLCIRINSIISCKVISGNDKF